MPSNDKEAELAALLAWYGDMGVRDLLGEAPVDWLSRGDAPPGEAFRLPARGVRPSGSDTHSPVIPEAEPQARLSGTSRNESEPASRGPGSERCSPLGSHRSVRDDGWIGWFAYYSGAHSR